MSSTNLGRIYRQNMELRSGNAYVTIVTHTMECGEKSSLVEEHHHAALAYSKATRALNRSAVSHPEHQRRLNLVNEARTKSQEARLAVERHVAEHGC
jgi:hypothetical protein